MAYGWATYFVPETANLSLEETDKLFRSSAEREDMALKRQVCCPFAPSVVLTLALSVD
jgi:hypothetical protein